MKRMGIAAVALLATGGCASHSSVDFTRISTGETELADRSAISTLMQQSGKVFGSQQQCSAWLDEQLAAALIAPDGAFYNWVKVAHTQAEAQQGVRRFYLGRSFGCPVPPQPGAAPCSVPAWDMFQCTDGTMRYIGMPPPPAAPPRPPRPPVQ